MKIIPNLPTKLNTEHHREESLVRAHTQFSCNVSTYRTPDRRPNDVNFQIRPKKVLSADQRVFCVTSLSDVTMKRTFFICANVNAHLCVNN